MEKGEVFVPSVIQEQFKLENFTMLKMFLAAFASSLLFNSFVWALDAEKFNKSRGA